MKKVIKGTIGVIVISLVIIQFFRPEQNKATGISENDITTQYTVPGNVLGVLKRSCYDCHSNNTVYPWYNNIQPFAWFLADHVKEGKAELNFSEFASYKPKKAAHKLDEVISEIEEGAMPLSSYTAIHRNAKLSAEEVKLITAWATGLGDSIRQANHLPE